MGIWKRSFIELIAELPYSLREEVSGYVDSVEESAKDIFREAGVKYSDEAADEVLFVAGVRRLYSLTNTYYLLLDRSLELLGSDARAISLGRSRLQRGEGEMLALKKLKRKFDTLLVEQGLVEVVRIGALTDVVLAVSGRGDGPR